MRWIAARLTALFLMLATTTSAVAETPLYELRVYTCNAGKLDALNTRFRDHTLRLFEKHGMKNIAYWVPTEGPEAETTLYYIVQHNSEEAARASWAGFLADPDWKQVAAASEAAHGKILASAPTRTYMTCADFCPKLLAGNPNKVYELRTYVAADGKFDALQTRFRDHTVKLFEKNGIKSYGYWIPSQPPASNTTLIYLLEHESREAAQANWQKFRNDPEWQTAKTASEANGPLLAKPPEAMFLKTVDYTPKSVE